MTLKMQLLKKGDATKIPTNIKKYVQKRQAGQ